MRRGLKGMLVGTLGFLVGCGSCGKADVAVDAAPVESVVEAKVPAPDDLLADGVLLTPNASWTKLQRGIGGAVGLMPQTAGGLVCSLGGLDLALASEIDGTAPMYLALAGEPDDPEWLLAAKVVEQRKARDVLLDAETAKYTGHDENGTTVLKAKGGAPSTLGLGLTRSGYLLIGKTEATLGKLGPYATRTLPTLPPGKSALHVDVKKKALSGRLRTALEKRWQAYAVDLLAEDAKMRENRGGRAPDFADPKAIVGIADGLVQKRIATVASLEKLAIDVEVGDDDLHVVAEAEGPAEGGALAPMTVGATAPLFEVPKDAIAALLTRSTGPERETDAKEIETALSSALGSRLPDAEQKKLHALLEEVAKNRGDALTLVGLGGDNKAKGLVLRADAKSPDALGKSVGLVADLLRSPTFKEPLRLKSLQRSTGEAKGVGKCDMLDLTVEGRGKLPDTKLGLAWTVEGGSLTAALGDSPLELVSRGARPEEKLSSDKVHAKYLEALGKEASFVFYAQPFLVDQSKPVPPSPAVLAWGARETRGRWLRVDVADRVLRELLKKQLGL